jgi:hypothetical protein
MKGYLKPFKPSTMKSRIFLLAVVLLGFSFYAQANNGPGDGKKDDIMGTVINSDNKKPLKDVSVTAYLVSKKEKIELTNDEGNFSFDELKPGTYKFVFEKAGFKRVTREKVVVRTDEAFQLNIEMIESNGFDLMPSPFHFSDYK